MDSYHQEKIQKYEEFIDRRLKPDLVKAIAERYIKLFSKQFSCRDFVFAFFLFNNVESGVGETFDGFLFLLVS